MNLLRCLGDCLLLRGPGRDVTDPSDRHRGGGVGPPGQRWGGYTRPLQLIQARRVSLSAPVLREDDDHGQ